MSKEAMKLALEALEPLVRRAAPWGELDWLNGCKAISALREALAEPDFWEGYVPEPVKPAQCKYPKCSYPCTDLPDCRDAEQPAQQEPVALEPAPDNSLPKWDECALRVSNSELIAKRVTEGGYGPDHNAKLASALHRFIYEYDDADPYRSGWFLHRLEQVISECTSPPAQRTWVGLEKSDMPDGADPIFDDPKFIAGMVYAANKLMEKNT